MERARVVAWYTAAVGFIGWPLGYEFGNLIVQDEIRTKNEAKQCVVELGRVATGDSVPEICQQFTISAGPRENYLPPTEEIERDFVKPPLSNPDEVRDRYSGYGILGGLIFGYFIGRGATSYMPRRYE